MDFAARREAGCLSLVPQRALKLASTSEETTHNRAFGHPRGFGNFRVAQAFDVRQLNGGTELGRQLVDRPLDGVRAEVVEHGVLDIGNALAAIAAELVIEEKFLGVLERTFLGSTLLAAVGVDVSV